MSHGPQALGFFAPTGWVWPPLLFLNQAWSPSVFSAFLHGFFIFIAFVRSHHELAGRNRDAGQARSLVDENTLRRPGRHEGQDPETGASRYQGTGLPDGRQDGPKEEPQHGARDCGPMVARVRLDA